MTNALTPIVICQATAADREAVIELLLAQFREHDISLSAAALTAAIDGVLEHPEWGSVFVATLEGTPIGVAYLSFTWALEHGGKTAWLEELYVVPKHRGRGVGRAMLTAVCEHAFAQGCAAVDLEVDAAHRRAAHLYAREGFQRLDRTRWVRVLR
ncbi:MAG TPA: GNAT family N-acetyltransferase [Alphaproteobacteria bacterium]|nr:GNAT family N-acetyltransferase [Alphaproteobacteria bacterium]